MPVGRTSTLAYDLSTDNVLVGADVAVTAAAGPAGGAPGRPVSIANTVVNNGPVAVTFTVAFYLSADDVFDPSVDVLLGFRAVTALAPATASAVTSVVTIPAGTVPGVYRILVRADAGASLIETSEINNVRATGPITIVRSDLSVTALTAPALAAPGAAIGVSHTVRNGALAPGTAPASISRFYLSTDAILDGADVALGTAAVPALGAGLTATVVKSLTIPVTTAPGLYFILARADDANAIVETDDSNNTRATATPLAVGPDLVVPDVTAPARALPGQLVTLNSSVQNVGTGMPVGQTSKVAFYLSTDNVLDGADVLLGSLSIPSLAAAATFTGSLTVAIPAGTAAGTYSVLARADAGGSVTEARETNNVRAAAITIAAP